MMKLGFTMGLTIGGIAAFALLEKNKFNRLIKKVKN